MFNFNCTTLPSDAPARYNGQGGLRFGTNVISARGYQRQDCKQVASYLHEMVNIGHSLEKPGANIYQEAIALKDLSHEIEEFAEKFPLPGITSEHIF